MFDLLSLNDDVLLLIFSYIYGNDALNFSLASKRAHILASPRITANLALSSPDQLRKLHQYLLTADSGGRPRARSLKTLSVLDSVYEREDEDWGLEYYKSDFSNAHLLGDILLQADRLRELTFDRLYPCVVEDPRIGAAVCAMSRLTTCTLSAVGDATLATVQAMQSRLTQLELHYHDLEDRLQEKPKTFPTLLSTLSVFPLLHTVVLRDFEATSAHPPMSYPQLPSIRNLALSLSSPDTLDLVDQCPNLSTLEVSFIHRPGTSHTVHNNGHRDHWPELKRLSITRTEDIQYVIGRVGRVRQLQLSGDFEATPVTEAGEDSMNAILGLIERTSPIGLYLAAEISLRYPASTNFWARLAENAPRLLSVEIKVEITSDENEFNDYAHTYTWLKDFPDALGPLRLLCLRLLVPAISRPLWFGISPFSGMTPSKHKEIVSHAFAADRRRVAALVGLQHRLVDVLPTLRYLAVGDALENNEFTNPTFLTTDGIGIIREYWDDMRFIGQIGQMRWWRIRHEGDRRELNEVSEEMGEHVQHTIETSNFEEGSPLEAVVSALSL